MSWRCLKVSGTNGIHVFIGTEVKKDLPNLILHFTSVTFSIKYTEYTVVDITIKQIHLLKVLGHFNLDLQPDPSNVPVGHQALSLSRL